MRLFIAAAALLALTGAGHDVTVVRVDPTVRTEWTDPATGQMRGIVGGEGQPPIVVAIPSRTGAMAAAPDNRLDLLVVGDGYTAADEANFERDAAALERALLSKSPYIEYRNFVRTRALFVASPQRGADHPPCRNDPYALPDGKEGTYVDTAFDASYCSFGTQRSLTINVAKVLLATGAEGFDKVIVLVNDDLPGGSGGPVMVTSLAPQTVEITQHEFAHTFAGLADEYDSPFPYPACSDVDGFGRCEANVTDQTAREKIKWAPWIATSTPVPTPDSHRGEVGLFQGARYDVARYYRPKHTCAMRVAEKPFCEVCREAIVTSLYRGWARPTGDHVAGIEMIEPGSEQPSYSSPLFVAPGASVTFSFALLEPAGSPTAAIVWSVDGAAGPAGRATSFERAFPLRGTHTVTVAVTDSTPWLRAGTAPVTTRTWHVVVGDRPAGRRRAVSAP